LKVLLSIPLLSGREFIHHSSFIEKKMQQNIGKTDRIIRISIGVAIVVAGIITQSWWGLVGIVPLVTSMVSFCPLYTLLGFSTCERCSMGEKPGKSNERLS